MSRDRLVAVDAVIAAGYTAVLVAVTVAARGAAMPVWAQCLLVAGVGLPCAARRMWPVPVFGVVAAMSLLSLAVGVLRDPFAMAAFALYPVALAEPRRWWVPTPVIGALAALALISGTPTWHADGLALALRGAVLLGGAWTIGRAVRDRRAYVARFAAQLADRAVLGERLRIARELHDVVTHSIGLIAVKAGVANHVARSRPEEAHDALRVIEDTSRGALTELRHLLGVLRPDEPADADPPEGEFDPVPGLAGLPALAERAAMAGVRVDLDVRGTTELPEGVGVSVYRIVQEALTNVVKHAAPARAAVTVEADGREVRVVVADDGPGLRAGQGRSGHGLVGMWERTMAYGGEFGAGTRREGGFAVSARLPYQERDDR
ncbi:sensor histidine kinase [Solihabitans fulvus]|uniref:histidine kinase n=2 Tax=Solihabitans fulvus TaxID=1892852 RepID=A0A5B2XQY5_9PSEU|nr:sensor histidine kinase [Solihabitans fulvus]